MAPGRLQKWLESFSKKPGAAILLFCVAFAEASCVPLSVDAVLVALGVSAPKRVWKLTLVAVSGSFLGGYAGYAIGLWLFESVGRTLLSIHGMTEKFQIILDWYGRWGFLTLLFSGLTPIPYIVFTIAAGFNQTVDLLTLTAGTLLGRALRFSLVGGLLAYYGARAKAALDRYFGRIALSFVLLIIAGFIAFKWIV